MKRATSACAHVFIGVIGGRLGAARRRRGQHDNARRAGPLRIERAAAEGARSGAEDRSRRRLRRAFLRRRRLAGSARRRARPRAIAQDLADAVPPAVPPWSKSLGAPVLASPYGVPSKFEANVRRRESPGLTRTPHSSVAFTPLQNLFGIITPSGLHFERHHAGMPEIDPHQHRLMIHGLVRAIRASSRWTT